MVQAPANYPGEEKRRSTRIAQAVPLTVRGVDLLGQPFEEPSSTLILNSHGCKYASKHHLPKNTWLTLELPQREDEAERPCMRARVAWIQRPRTVREPFQIGVEFENPGNFWRIPAPPDDWRSPSQTGNRGASRQESAVAMMQGSRGTRNVGLDPGTAEKQTTLESYLERTLTEASMTTWAATKASPAIAMEPSPLLRELRLQMERQAEQVVGAALLRASEEIRGAAEKLDREHQASAKAFYEQWKGDFEREYARASEKLFAQAAAQWSGMQQQVRSSVMSELETSLDRAHESLSKAELRGEVLRSGIESAAQEARAYFEKSRAEMDAATAAGQQQRKHIVEEATLAGDREISAWREKREAEMEVARAQWSELLQSSLDSAGQHLVRRLAECSQNAVETAEQQITARLAELGEPLSRTTAEARQALADVQASLDKEVTRARASLADIEQAANRMSEYSAQLEAASQDTVNELHRRLETILTSEAAELTRRAESLADGLPERLGSTLESMQQQFAARSIADAESKLAPQLERAQEALHQLDAREAQSEETLRLYRERLRQASESSLRETESQMVGTRDQLRNEFEEARRAALTKWSEEIEASGVRVTHTTFDTLVKASDWHQQQAKASAESLLDEALGKARQSLEGIAGEISQQLAAQLDAQRNAYIQQARGSLEGAGNEVLGKTCGQVEVAAQSAAARFGEVLHRISEESTGEFAAASRGVLEEQTGQLQNAFGEVRRDLESGAAKSLEHFETRLAEWIRDGMGEAQEALANQLAAAMESFRAQISAYEREWQTSLERLNGESLEQYRERVRAACDSWIVSSVGKLNECGNDVIGSLSKAAEQAVRKSCSEVFGALADRVRASVLDATGPSHEETPYTPSQPRPASMEPRPQGA